MSLLMGALGGLGAGLSGVAAGRIQNIDQRALEQMQQQMEIAKEQRIEEMQKAREQRGEAKDIRSETRALTNAELARKAQFEFETNPENVNLRSEADVAKQRALDEYKYATQGQEAGYQKAMAEAKYGPMYEARAANVTRQGTSAKLDKATELQYKHLIARADASRKRADNETDEVKQLQYKDQAMKLEQAAKDLLTSAGSSGALPGEGGPSSNDPLGLRAAQAEQDRINVVGAIEGTGASADFTSETDTKTLKQVENLAKQGKIDRALGEGPKGLLGQSREQLLSEINKLTNGNFDVPSDTPTPELAKIVQQLRKDASEQLKRDVKQRAAEEEKAKSKAEQESKTMKRMTGLMGYKPKYISERESGL